MKETAVQINERKIRNGIRKQAEKIQREKEKVWDRLKVTDSGKPAIRMLEGHWMAEQSTEIDIQHGLGVESVLAEMLKEEILNEQRNE